MKTISNYEILMAAYDTILGRWMAEVEKIERGAQEGSKRPIAEKRAEKYSSQLKEIAAVMNELEQQMKKEG